MSSPSSISRRTSAEEQLADSSTETAVPPALRALPPTPPLAMVVAGKTASEKTCGREPRRCPNRHSCAAPSPQLRVAKRPGKEALH